MLLFVVVVLCQVGAELVVMTNYAYAIVCMTPLTLALSSLAHQPLDAGARHWLTGAVGRGRQARAAMGAGPHGVVERAGRLLAARWDNEATESVRES